MIPIRIDTVLRAPRRLVWDVLADLERVSSWNPAIDFANCISEERSGMHARRECCMHPSGRIVEAVSEWHPEEIIAFSTVNASPLNTGLGRFVLTDDRVGTRLQASFDYEIRFGPLGPVIDRLIVHRQLSSAWAEGMAGLRNYVEELADSPSGEMSARII